MYPNFKIVVDRNSTINKRLIIYSPFIIIVVNILVAILFGSIIGKWAFIPIILVEWLMFLLFIHFQKKDHEHKKWLKSSIGKSKAFWATLCIIIGLIPLPIFLKHYHLLADLTVFIPWFIIFLINSFLEEYYWRGVLLDQTKFWNPTISVLYSSILFSVNHAVFGINSELFRGYEVMASTFIMGLVWSITYKRTDTLRWVILSHMLVDFLNLSSASFLDLYKPNF